MKEFALTFVKTMFIGIIITAIIFPTVMLKMFL